LIVTGITKAVLFCNLMRGQNNSFIDVEELMQELLSIGALPHRHLPQLTSRIVFLVWVLGLDAA
jgi:hypothetical protein